MQSILNYHFKLLDEMEDDSIINLLETPVFDNTRILIDRRAEGEFEGIFVFAENIKEKVYDFVNEKFTEITSQKYISVDFNINMDTELLEIWGSKKGAQKVIGALSQVFANQVIIEQYELSLEKMVEYLKDCNMVSVGKVKAKGIVVEDGLLADCTFDLSLEEKPFRVLDKYKKNIDRIRFDLETDNIKIGVTLYRSGMLSVHRNKEFISDVIMSLLHRIIIASRR